MQDIIERELLSFEEIFNDLKEYAESKPTTQTWQDYLASGAGTTLLELIAGLGAYHAFIQLEKRRESNIDTAMLESSILELAFNRGLMVAPSDTMEMTISITANEDTSIEVNQKVAEGEKFSCYSLEAKSINAGDTKTLKCACGNQKIFTEHVQGMEPFTTFNFLTTDKYIASDASNGTKTEILTIDSNVINLLSDLNYLQSYGNDFVLRRVIPNEVKIYIGNGTLGWYSEQVNFLSYTCLTYDDNSFENTDITPALEKPGSTSTNPQYYSIDIISYVIDLLPVYGMDKEEVRKTAIYYPIDGRIVTNSDYENVIIKYYGGVLLDVLSYNLDHDQEVVLLKDDNFLASSLLGITNLVDLKRGAGINVIYIEKSKTDGVVIDCSFKLTQDDYYEGILTSVTEFLGTKLFEFMRGYEDTVITTTTLAIELSSYFGKEFYPNDSNTTTLTKSDFIQQFNIEVLSYGS